MPQVIDINEDDISYAENILLPEGKEFDAERIAFIRDFRTLDLQAVPGSGKTTSLLAKLLILERKLPFADGSGVLVISHTNAAIDEIRHKIQKHCPKLFSYPNFIGTIQGFVDEFMAVPFYNFGFKQKLNWIDTDKFQDELLRLFNIIAWKKEYEEPTKWLYQRHITRATAEAGGNAILAKEICKRHLNNEIRGIYYDFITDEIKTSSGDVLLKDNKNAKFKGLKSIIVETLKRGIISYDYAYHIAELYLHKNPLIIEIIQKRFLFVFVDEMQDMDTHQYNLLEKLFYDGEDNLSIIQRIGDKNQAIYNSVKATDVWVDRETILKFSGSQRLSKPIADAVKKFALYHDVNFDINGLNECVIKPHILLFEDSTIVGIIPYFAQLVKECKENGSLINQSKPVKVVCWNTNWKDDDVSRADSSKLRLEDYFHGFKKEKGKPKQDYDCLKSYLLFYDKSKNTLEPIRKNILKAFLKILSLENVYGDDGRPYTKKKMIDFIREKDHLKYEEINENVYNWSFGIIKGNIDEVWASLKNYVPTFFGVFSTNRLSASASFLALDNSGVSIIVGAEPVTKNIYEKDDVEIEITSVHAVKGQTHSATLYLESYYYEDGGNSYESQRLSSQFLNNSITGKVGERVKQSAKMAYVGFSRPTDLLCIAMHKARFEQYLNSIDREQWEVKEVTLPVD